jgi:hypothetical protein
MTIDLTMCLGRTTPRPLPHTGIHIVLRNLYLFNVGIVVIIKAIRNPCAYTDKIAPFTGQFAAKRSKANSLTNGCVGRVTAQLRRITVIVIIVAYVVI